MPIETHKDIKKDSEDKGMKKRVKIVLIILATIFVLFLTGGLYVGNMLYNLALNPNTDKSSVINAEHNSMSMDDVVVIDDEIREKAKHWYDNADIKDYSLTSRDNLKLHALAVTQPGNLWAIVCHGYSGEASQNSTSAYRFYEEGYNVLMPNARGHGKSEGDYIGMGWDERLDIVDWIWQILDKDPDAQIVLYGVSMGAATVMMVSGEDLPQNVKAIVEDCGYSSVWGEFSYQLKMLFGLPDVPVMNFASFVTKVRAGWWLEEGDAIKQLQKNKTPMMFIHGDDDTFVPFEMLDKVYEATDVLKEKLLVEGAGHGGSAGILGEEYWNAVFNFINQHVTAENK